MVTRVADPGGYMYIEKESFIYEVRFKQCAPFNTYHIGIDF